MNEKQIVFKLAKLEAELVRKQREMANQKELYERNKPIPPRQVKGQLIQYPKIVPHAKYNYLLGIIFPICLVIISCICFILNNYFCYMVSLICFINAVALALALAPIMHSNDKKKNFEEQRKSQEYTSKCKEIDDINRETMREIDEENNRLIAKYMEYSEKHNNNWLRIKSVIENEIKAISNELVNLYD